MRDDLTLISINWNNRPCTELMLRSYVKHHEGVHNLILVDNDSQDDSREFFRKNGVPYIGLYDNIGHEQALNVIYPLIKTRYALIVDTDIQFIDNVHSYLDHLDDKTIIAGDLITGDSLGSPIKQRVAPWFFLFDIQAIKAKGVNTFRDTGDWSYDNGSWMTERIFEHGFKHYQIPRFHGNQDLDMVGMQYEKYWHWLRMSWNLKNHADREYEVGMRRNHIREQLKYYQDIELHHKFRLI